MEEENGKNIYNRRALIFLLFIYWLVMGDGLLLDQSQTFRVPWFLIRTNHTYLRFWCCWGALSDRTVSAEYRVAVFLSADSCDCIGISYELLIGENLPSDIMGL